MRHFSSPSRGPWLSNGEGRDLPSVLPRLRSRWSAPMRKPRRLATAREAILVVRTELRCNRVLATLERRDLPERQRSWTASQRPESTIQMAKSWSFQLQNARPLLKMTLAGRTKDVFGWRCINRPNAMPFGVFCRGGSSSDLNPRPALIGRASPSPVCHRGK
jgi:hypothetical protein